jgi:hypothetical protein
MVPPEEPTIIYLISPLPDGRWFVDSASGSSGYSFHSLPEAERFATLLAQKNAPSRIHVTGPDGEVIDEKIFE